MENIFIRVSFGIWSKSNSKDSRFVLALKSRVSISSEENDVVGIKSRNRSAKTAFWRLRQFQSFEETFRQVEKSSCTNRNRLCGENCKEVTILWFASSHSTSRSAMARKSSASMVEKMICLHSATVLVFTMALCKSRASTGNLKSRNPSQRIVASESYPRRVL